MDRQRRNPTCSCPPVEFCRNGAQSFILRTLEWYTCRVGCQFLSVDAKRRPAGREGLRVARSKLGDNSWHWSALGLRRYPETTSAFDQLMSDPSPVYNRREKQGAPQERG